MPRDHGHTHTQRKSSNPVSISVCAWPYLAPASGLQSLALDLMRNVDVGRLLTAVTGHEKISWPNL